MCDFLCAGCLSVWKKKIQNLPCALLPFQSIFLYSQSAHVVYEAMYIDLNTNKCMRCRGLVDRPFSLYTCFSPTTRPKYRAIKMEKKNNNNNNFK